MKCEGEFCPNQATHLYTWRADTMSAPASWCGCITHTAEWLATGVQAGAVEARVEPLLPESFQQSPE
jgi:hypothetical protein